MLCGLIILASLYVYCSACCDAILPRMINSKGQAPSVAKEKRLGTIVRCRAAKNRRQCNLTSA